ncbi:hypothetical protein [Streptomyces sp. NRRL F-5123]|uniref:hypothetical protein n=1 Tax=Streptomyces sp. NRRL F-5123 TaxID=1463856 RepID=UPI000AEAD7C2|nr:hypothetical protein [Streptomyces sp. NRRL F-5123]
MAEDDDQGARHLALVAEQARFHVTLGAIRADLEEQPSTHSIRAAVRRWHEAITNVGEELVAQRRCAG